MKEFSITWLVWLSWLGIVPQRERSWVWSLLGAHAWAVGLVPSPDVCKRQPIDVSLLHWCFSSSPSPFLPFSLKSIKEKKFKELNITFKVEVELEFFFFLHITGVIISWVNVLNKNSSQNLLSHDPISKYEEYSKVYHICSSLLENEFLDINIKTNVMPCQC